MRRENSTGRWEFHYHDAECLLLTFLPTRYDSPLYMAVQKRVMVNSGEYDEKGQLIWEDDPLYSSEDLPQAAVGRVSQCKRNEELFSHSHPVCLR
jgi:hypothetical protein